MRLSPPRPSLSEQLTKGLVIEPGVVLATSILRLHCVVRTIPVDGRGMIPFKAKRACRGLSQRSFSGDFTRRPGLGNLTDFLHNRFQLRCGLYVIDCRRVIENLAPSVVEVEARMDVRDDRVKFSKWIYVGFECKEVSHACFLAVPLLLSTLAAGGF